MGAMGGPPSGPWPQEEYLDTYLDVVRDTAQEADIDLHLTNSAYPVGIPGFSPDPDTCDDLESDNICDPELPCALDIWPCRKGRRVTAGNPEG